MFISMAKLSSWVSNSDVAGPDANSAGGNVRYRIRNKASDNTERFFSADGTIPLRSHSLTDHRTIASKSEASSMLISS